MAGSVSSRTQTSDWLAARRTSYPSNRPTPVRVHSETGSSDAGSGVQSGGDPFRRKSTYAPFQDPSFDWRRPLDTRFQRHQHVTRVDAQAPTTTPLSPVSERSELGELQGQNAAMVLNNLTQPKTPEKKQLTDGDTAESQIDVTEFDFGKIDYELDRAWCLGKGLWSSVYLAHATGKSPQQRKNDASTPPTTPPRTARVRPCSLFAVKTPARRDAKEILFQEARILTKLQLSADAHQHIVEFHGLDSRNFSLVFEGVIGGSIEGLTSRLKVMTELARHLELRHLFPGLANDLANGLKFIHAANVVHADIKPGNILLDIQDQQDPPVIRARYIDFSASFLSEQDSAANAGGTWDFMAPEQMRIQKDLNTPTFASDVWSLGVTLLSIIVGGSPYTAACGSNVFMLREAIKSGDPLGFARMDPVVQKRLAASHDFVDCCRLALQKDRGRRATAAAWQVWLGN